MKPRPQPTYWTVIDTAPTGHTILLLDAAQAYRRELERQSRSLSADVGLLLPRLRDLEFTRILLVALAEATPVHEAAALQEDLRRASIEPYAWIVNQSLLPLEVRDPLLAAGCSQGARVALFRGSARAARETDLCPPLECIIRCRGPSDGFGLARCSMK